MNNETKWWEHGLALGIVVWAMCPLWLGFICLTYMLVTGNSPNQG